MKRILVIMVMVLCFSTASMAQSRKHSARKPKAKTERAMTEFEKQQKEEYLAYLLYSCKRYYEEGDIELAESCSRDYDKTKSKNYYVSFSNVEYTEEELAWYEKYGISISYGRDFYMDGYVINVYFDHDGKADDIMTNFKGVYGYNDYRPYEYKRMRYDLKKMDLVKEKLISQINELSGYNAKVSKRENNVKKFIDKHSSGTDKPTAKQDTVQRPNHPFGEKAGANRTFYQEHKSDYSAYNRQVNTEKQEKPNGKLVQNPDKAKKIHW